MGSIGIRGTTAIAIFPAPDKAPALLGAAATSAQVLRASGDPGR